MESLNKVNVSGIDTVSSVAETLTEVTKVKSELSESTQVSNRDGTVKFCYKKHLKLRPPSLLRSLVSVPKCNFQCEWVSLMRHVHYKDHF